MASRQKTGGRKPGTKNKRTVVLERARAENAMKITEALGKQAFDGDAHALLTSVYKDESKPIELRVHAAKAAIGYEKPRLTAVEPKGEEGLRLEDVILEAHRMREKNKKQWD